MERKVIVIAGPTASGKTALSLMLAEKLSSEIISADSRQVYRYLNIGTAKPEIEQLRRVRHHFIDMLMPDENFDAKQFENESLRIISSLHSKNVIPIVTGGTGLYIKALTEGMFDTASDEELRRKLLQRTSDDEGKISLYNELNEVDPASASRMLPQNYKRVVRALEVYYITGRPIWEHHSEYQRGLNITFCQYALNWPRELLYENINLRVDRMIESGLEGEVRGLLEMGYDRNFNSLNTVGYSEMIKYIQGEITFDTAVELIKRNSRRYAKRQLTWFRRDDSIKWFDIDSPGRLTAICDNICRDFL